MLTVIVSVQRFFVPYRSQIFSERLKDLCDSKQSYAQVARDLGINRQQLSRYMSGTTIPRDGLLSAIADYFGVKVQDLFAEKKPGPAKKTTGSPLAALGQIFKSARLDPISDYELEPGFYRQYKVAFRDPHKIFMTLAWIDLRDGVHHYKRRTSAKYLRYIQGSTVKNTFNGVFLRQGSTLILVDVGEALNDLTFHTLRTSNSFDRDVKPGHHFTAGHSEFGATPSRPFVLARLGKDESPLAVARTQGLLDPDAVPPGILKLIDFKPPQDE